MKCDIVIFDKEKYLLIVPETETEKSLLSDMESTYSRDNVFSNIYYHFKSVLTRETFLKEKMELNKEQKKLSFDDN